MFSQTILSTLKAGLKFGFDLDPIVTEHFFHTTLFKTVRTVNETNELFRIFGNKFATIPGILHDFRSMTFGDHL